MGETYSSLDGERRSPKLTRNGPRIKRNLQSSR